MPFLVSAGDLSAKKMLAGTNALANAWGGTLLRFSSADSPEKVLTSLPNENGLVQLLGDPAIFNSKGGSWLEALANWKKSIALMVEPLPSGEIPGVAAAYVSLCESLSVPLLGIIQIGGTWNPLNRRLDGLPWCGWLDDKAQRVSSFHRPSDQTGGMDVKEVEYILRQRIKQISIEHG